MIIISSLKNRSFDFSFLKYSSLFLIIFFISLTSAALKGQNKFILTHEDTLALENVIVEKYYVANDQDYADTSGGILPNGAVTYRIFIDMKPGYSLMSVYGDTMHQLFVKSTAPFFNNLTCYAMTGFNVHHKEINENTVALDSWITLGAASRLHTGIPREDDKDGSVLKRRGLDKADGLTNGIFPTLKLFNLNVGIFNDKEDATTLSTYNGAWYCLEGVKGPNADNKVLIAQLTTSGKLSFALNIQLRTPSQGAVKFVAQNPKSSEIIPEIEFNGLTY